MFRQEKAMDFSSASRGEKWEKMLLLQPATDNMKYIYMRTNKGHGLQL
jgi:hypothetical protein